MTLPLYRGQLGDGRNVWYILTDTTDEGNARALGLNFSQKLNFAKTGRGSREGVLLADGLSVFSAGTVDFSPERVVVPGSGVNAFPPEVAQPGAVGDVDYSPLVTIQNAGAHTYN
jgi:hypothetical protein